MTLEEHYTEAKKTYEKARKNTDETLRRVNDAETNHNRAIQLEQEAAVFLDECIEALRKK